MTTLINIIIKTLIIMIKNSYKNFNDYDKKII